jgi:hypothetical protein
MSRSGYTDACDHENGALACWRGVIASATRGKRGQKFFRDLVAALDAMPVKRLIADELQTEEGEVCALGALGMARGVDMSVIDADDLAAGDAQTQLGDMFDIAEQLAQEAMWENDEAGRGGETAEQRWTRVRAWAARQIRVLPEELLEAPEATP